MNVYARKTIILFIILFLTWHILYIILWAFPGLDWLIAYSVVLAVIICYFIIDKQKIVDLGFRKPSLWKRYIIIGFIFAVLITLYGVGLGALIPPTVPKQVSPYGIFSILYNALFALVVGLVEETSFRGYILRNLREIYSDTRAIIYSSLLFGLYHISLVWIFLSTLPPSQTFTYWTSYVLFTFMVGVFLGYFYVNTEQSTIGTTAHHSSHIFLQSLMPYSLAISFTIGHIFSTIAYAIFLPLLIHLNSKGWLTDKKNPYNYLK